MTRAGGTDKDGAVRTVINRYKTVLDPESDNVVGIPLRAVYRVIGGTAAV